VQDRDAGGGRPAIHSMVCFTRQLLWFFKDLPCERYLITMAWSIQACCARDRDLDGRCDANMRFALISRWLMLIATDRSSGTGAGAATINMIAARAGIHGANSRIALLMRHDASGGRRRRVFGGIQRRQALPRGFA